MIGLDVAAQAAPLARYDAACRAIAEARSVDEAKEILDQAVAIAAYARQAKNRDLEADAVEIRMRATRRLDELRRAQKETIGLNEGGRPPKTGSADNPVWSKPTLASQGIDKNLAHQARVLGAMSEDAFERKILAARDVASRVFHHTVREVEKAQQRGSFTFETPRALLPTPVGRKLRIARKASEHQWLLAIGPNISRAELMAKAAAARSTDAVQDLDRGRADIIARAAELEAEAARLREEAKALGGQIDAEIRKAVGPVEPFTVTHDFRADAETDAELAVLPQKALVDRLLAARGAVDESLKETNRGLWGDMNLLGVTQQMSAIPSLAPSPGLGPREGWNALGSPEWLEQLFPDWNDGGEP